MSVGQMKHRIVHTLQKYLLNPPKYLLNPPIKLALAIGLPLPGHALLETKRRNTGKLRRTPVGDGRTLRSSDPSASNWRHHALG